MRFFMDVYHGTSKEERGDCEDSDKVNVNCQFMAPFWTDYLLVILGAFRK